MNVTIPFIAAERIVLEAWLVLDGEFVARNQDVCTIRIEENELIQHELRLSAPCNGILNRRVEAGATVESRQVCAVVAPRRELDSNT